jgi:hypothetical protein
MTPSTNVVGYQHFRWPCCLYLQGEVNSAMKGTLIWGGSIRGLESVQANIAEARSRVPSSLIGTGSNSAPCIDLQGKP